MSLLDQCLEHPDRAHAVHDEEFVLLHIDSVETTGFISHLKLPHYVTFQSELDSVRRSRHMSAADRELRLPTADGGTAVVGSAGAVSAEAPTAPAGRTAAPGAAGPDGRADSPEADR